MALGAGLLAIPWNTSLHAVESIPSDRYDGQFPKDISPLHQGSVWLAKIANVITPSVVHIHSERRTANRGRVEETGSGVIMTSSRFPGQYFVVTNRHVIEGATLDNISISLHDGREVQPERVWSDKATDIAILKISAPDLVAAQWGDSNQVEIGHLVLAMGSPFGLSRSVTLGIISAKGRRSLKLGAGSEVLNQDFLQTDAAINPGNSGGPLIDMNGRVIGINTAIASQGGGNEGIGFSIPANLAERVMEQLLETGVVRRAYLGVRLDPAFDAKAARRLKLDKVQGTRVTEVYPKTPASAANLQVDDVILTFDGLNVQDESHLINLVSLTPIGKTVRLNVWRDGRQITVHVTLADRKDLEGTSEAPAMPEFGYPVRQMGLTVEPLSPDRDGTAHGLRIVSVDRSGPLASEIEVGDVIEAVARAPVASIEDLESALARASDREAVLLKVRRPSDGERSQLVVWRPRDARR
jgi:serine protease Do